MPISPKCRGARLRARTLPTCGVNGLRVAIESIHKSAMIVVGLGRHRLMKVQK